jgi:RES domain
MELDNPTLPEFASWRSYEAFSRRIRGTRRYVWSDEVQAFLDTVLATLRRRDVKISSGQVLFRAQLGVRHEPVLDDNGVEIGEEPVGFCPARMKPRLEYAKEGRVNSTGIPVLYLASEEETAISEVRPWVGSEVSVAQFKILRDLNAVNLSVGYGKSSIARLTFAHLLGDKQPSAKIKERAVWTSIDNAFSQPVMGGMTQRIMLRRKFLPSFFGKRGTKQSSIGVNLEKKAIT